MRLLRSGIGLAALFALIGLATLSGWWGRWGQSLPAAEKREKGKPKADSYFNSGPNGLWNYWNDKRNAGWLFSPLTSNPVICLSEAAQT